MTLVCPDPSEALVVLDGVYQPQEDSRLLIEAARLSGVVPGRHVVDLCTGSGVVAVAAARLGAASVIAYDTSPRAVQCADTNFDGFGSKVRARLGSLAHALSAGPFDVVLCNPPYVPTAPRHQRLRPPGDAGPTASWSAGVDGREVLDPLCYLAGELLGDGGTLMLVQSEFADVDASLMALQSSGLHAEIVASERIPFGPALHGQAAWLERSGRLSAGCREENLVVIRADKP